MTNHSYQQRGNDDSSDDEGWRDKHLEQAPPGLPRLLFDDSSTLVSGRSNSRASSTADSFSIEKTRHSNLPGDYWVLPPHCTPLQILGPEKARMNEIARATGVYLAYNNSLHQIDIWGDTEARDKAKRHLTLLANRITEEDPMPSRTTKKWSRPERELTEKEKRREEKRQQRILEEKRYLGEPAEKQSYHSVYYIPQDRSVSIAHILGNNESYLNEIRVDCKTFIEYDLQLGVFRLSSGEEENIKMAASRLRNWHLRCTRVPEGGKARLMQQPTGNLMLKYRKLPSDFVLYEYVSQETEITLREKQRLFETISTGLYVKHDLINFTDVNPTQCELPERVKSLDERNEKVIEPILDRGLESLRLKDWDIRMKIRYGTICLVDFPRKDDENLTIEYVSDKMFKRPKFNSVLAPCISKTRENLDSLFEYLGAHGQEFSDNPRTSFVIIADQHPVAATPKESRKREVDRGEMWRTRMDVAFTDKGERGLWSTVTECTDLVDISCFDPERPYSWDLKLQYARRLPSDDMNAPHEKFSHNLRLNPNGRLILVSVLDYNPEIVTQKTKWRYSWNDFIVEICKEELWDFTQIERKDKDLPLDLSGIDPHRSQYKVSMYREAWLNRLAENLCLRVGEAPSWNLRQFLGTKEENVRSLIDHAKNFGKILANEVPVYYDQSFDSLV